MIEPSRTDRNINFRRIPEQIRCFRYQFTASQILGHSIYAQSLIDFIRTRIRIRHQSRCTPFRGTSQSTFITYPTHIIAHDSGNCLRLKTTDSLQNSVPIIFLLLSVRSFAVSSIKPYLMHFSVIGKQFSQLFDEKLIISFSLSVTFRITIPRRKIDSEFQSILVTSFAEFLYHIPFSVFPWRRSNRMLGCPGRPQAETIMMLGSNDSHFEATFLQSSYPLFTIQFGRIENGRIFFTISPFTACKGINTKMKETSEFHLLPCQLLRCRHQAGSHIYLLCRSRSCRKSYVFLIILLCLSSQKSTK